ncbi:MAG TPA: hypothetical protein VFI65_26600 [Streptosporangiaceae bacterium]|nr:hypothetical protein [Streptosporangiaceae bacterium]
MPSSISRQCSMAAVKPSRASTEKKTVPKTATPTAPASCCMALTTPEAEPTSASVTAARMKSNSGAITMPMPMPSTGAQHAGEEHGDAAARLPASPGNLLPRVALVKYCPSHV